MFKKALLVLLLGLLSPLVPSADAYYAVRYREHVTDCTSLTDGKQYDYCFEIDSNDVYKCVPTAGGCDTAAEWQRTGSYATVELYVIEYSTNLSTGDGKSYFRVPARLNGMNLATVHAQVITAGSGGATTIQIARCSNAASGNACSSTVVNMLSTAITIDTGEDSSDTAAAAAVVNTSNDDVSSNQIIRVDIDGVPGTPPKGLLITLTFIRS